MADAKVKTQEKEEVVIEEEVGVFQRTTERISPVIKEKRKREEESPVESPSKYVHTSDGNRSARTTTTTEQDSLSVPFWKHINRRDSSFQFQSNEIGSFSILRRTDDKECFDDKRYLRGKCSYLFENLPKQFLFLVYKYPLQTLNVNFDLKIGESDYISEGRSENIDPMLWWALRHKQDIFKNNR
jgi:hypothetical protein